mmetsp:Transcript_17461/g.26428  ORF Transcript_17461/g.26428 Transcript_17461/m.26428 type:complete len:117 (+) Transcript_17461:2-352(+)
MGITLNTIGHPDIAVALTPPFTTVIIFVTFISDYLVNPVDKIMVAIMNESNKKNNRFMPTKHYLIVFALLSLLAMFLPLMNFLVDLVSTPSPNGRVSSLPEQTTPHNDDTPSDGDD